ncbi:MAG: hypothetical protein KDE22_10360, partial [Rhodobacterales bacterium]|nr:hypothetical protein [Rhodobacterales bacterium]
IPTRTLRFNLPAARDRVLALLADTAADRLWVPAFEGAHQDHDAANALAATLADRIAVWEFAEYGFAGGRPRRNRFPDPAPGDTVIDLTADEKAVKVRALELYGSEAANLAHTGTARESIRPLPRHAYDRPPHDGRLFYQRFQWVPFRHPRVDFTDPWDVARDLARFYGSVSDS